MDIISSNLNCISASGAIMKNCNAARKQIHMFFLSIHLVIRHWRLTCANNCYLMIRKYISKILPKIKPSHIYYLAYTYINEACYPYYALNVQECHLYFVVDVVTDYLWMCISVYATYLRNLLSLWTIAALIRRCLVYLYARGVGKAKCSREGTARWWLTISGSYCLVLWLVRLFWKTLSVRICLVDGLFDKTI